MRSGVILAGGRSTRFGDADKAVADLGGAPMIRRVADRIADVVDELIVNCRADQTATIREAMAGYPLGVVYAPDETPDQGPLVGLRNGLAAAGGEVAFVVACDMPFVEPAVATHLFDRVEGHDAAVPRLADGRLQPLQAVYAVEPTVSACDGALERGDRRAVAPLSDLDCVVVDAEELGQVASMETFRNVNTREEFEAARRRIETG